MCFLGQDYDYNNNNDENNGQEGEGGEEETPEGGNDESEGTTEEPEQPENVSEQPVSTPVTPVYRSPKPRGYRPTDFGSVRQSSVQNPGVEYDEIIDKNAPIATPPPKIPLKNKVPNSKSKPNTLSTPVTGLQYRPQPQQPYITPQPVSGKS
jgi:hypothetical protein